MVIACIIGTIIWTLIYMMKDDAPQQEVKQAVKGPGCGLVLFLVFVLFVMFLGFLAESRVFYRF